MTYIVSGRVREAADRLMTLPEVMAGLSWIEGDHQRCIREQVELTCLEAPTFHERERALALERKFREAGLSDVRIDRGGNVIGVRRGCGRGPRVLIEAHMDTVFPLGSVSGVEERDGMLLAPGISDDTRGLAVLLSLARALDACGVPLGGDLIFAGTTREEGGGSMRGMTELLEDLQGRIDASISVDSGCLANIIYEATGIRTVEVTFRGIGGHAFVAFGQVAQPVHAAARAAAKIAALQVPDDPRTTFCVSNFHAGNEAAMHAIPAEASITINYRSNDAAQLEALEKRIFTAIQEACNEETARWGKDVITWSLRDRCDVPAGTQDVHAPMVEGLYSVLERLHLQPNILRGGATNCNIAIARGIPAVCMSTCHPVDGATVNTMDHTLSERFPMAGAYKGVQAALMMALLCTGVGELESILEAR